MSRPPKFPGKPINKTLSVKVNEPLMLAIDEMCESYGMGRSELVRMAIKAQYGKWQRSKEIPSG